MKMKKKMMFLFLLLQTIFGAANLYAQVTIGSDDVPHSGAILDLQSTEKGLKLPAVSLENVAEFKLSADATGAEGMMVYNTNDYTINGNGKGIYTWSGKWIFAGRNAPVDVPVRRIVITSEEGVNTVRAGQTLQLTGNVLPDTASNKKLAWSVLWSGSLTAGKASVNDTGLVTAVKSGSVTVRAAAIDGSGASRDFNLTVLPTSVATAISLSSETGADSVYVGRKLQLVAEISPETAYQAVKWEVVAGTKCATVDVNGLVSGVSEGLATISISTLDGLATTTEKDVRVLGAPLPSGVNERTMGGKKYKTYEFNGTEWMIESSRAGNPSEEHWMGLPDGEVYYYYTHENKTDACIGNEGWTLPTVAQAEAMIVYISLYATEAESNIFYKYGLAGYKNGSQFIGEGSSYLWLEEEGAALYSSGTLLIRMQYIEPPFGFGVRCIYTEL
jgi:hypothetical protein